MQNRDMDCRWEIFTIPANSITYKLELKLISHTNIVLLIPYKNLALAYFTSVQQQSLHMQHFQLI